ncbi:hypothetical protein [Microvirga roseola]|uniref:hypothetical protein n=1 Tax=Microvirga roseola TaxID=2883126 RepID=UPI001E5704A5|nr:hypothetical protein [Microvirga roseola]
MSEFDLAPAPGGRRFAPDEVIIYGVDLKTGPNDDPHAEILVRKDWIISLRSASDPAGSQYEIVAAYGYAYEGHCYRFDRPKILVFDTDDGGAAPGARAEGCGFGISADYKMWRVRPDADVLELAPQTDSLRKVLLEANMPGQRPPNTYSSHMMLAHRGGRLTGSGS